MDKENTQIFQLENPIIAKTYSQAKDYVLKRYRLEENRLFKQAKNDDLKYQAQVETKTKEQEEEQIVIIQDQLQTFQEHNQATSNHDQDMVYVFEEEEANISSPQLKAKQSLEKKFREEKKQTGLTIKSSSYGDASCQQLLSARLSPVLYKKKDDIHDANTVIDRLCSHSIQNDNLMSNRVDNDSDSSESNEEIKGVKIMKNEYEDDMAISIVDKRVFCISKLPSGIILRCIVKRTSSFINLMSPEYDLFLANGLKHIASAKKYPLRNRQLFKFSLDPCRFDDQNIIFTLHSNAYHNMYWLLDEPKRIQNQDLSFIYMAIAYQKIEKNVSKRRFIAVLPESSKKYQVGVSYEQSNLNFSLLQKQIKQQFKNVQDWKGNNGFSSKDFLIADDDGYRYLEMKKESDNVFQLIIQHPLSPIQAMAIALTRFDVQLK